MLVVVCSFTFVLHFVVVLHFYCCYSFIAFQCHPLPFRGLSTGFFHPLFTFSPVHRRVIRDTFLTFRRSSFTVLPRALRFWVSIFLPTGLIYLALLHWHFTCAYQGFLGACSSPLRFAGLHTDPRNTGPAHLFVWFTVIHNLHVQKNSFLNSVKYYHELLVVKGLVYMLLTRFELFSLVQSICWFFRSRGERMCL